MNEMAGSAGLKRRFQVEWAIVAAFASAIVSAALVGGWTRPADDLLYDVAMRLAPAQAQPEIMIVAIDEPSLASLGRWPWPRSLHARLLARLAEAKPAAITLDLLLTEPSEEDSTLAAAMQRGVPVSLPAQFLSPGRNGRAFERLDPAPALARAAAHLGHANTRIDSDGTVRSAALCFASGADAPALDHLMRPWKPGARSPSCQTPQRLRFAAPESFATISYASVLRGEVPPALMAGRRVLIGMTAQGQGDRYPVPVSDGSTMPGVEINANIANAQLIDGWIRQPSSPLALGLALLPAWLLLAAFWRIRPRSASLMVVLLAAAVLALSALALARGYWIAPGPALLGLVLVYPLWGWRRLQATSDYMARELTLLEREDALSLTTADPGDSDVVTHQAGQLSQAIAQLRDLRRFVGDTLAGLPDPALVSDAAGRIVMTNAAAARAFGRDMAGEPAADLLARMSAPGSASALATYLVAPEGRHIEFDTRDGRSFVLRRAPIVSAQGDVRGQIDYLTDVTDMVIARREREQMLQLLSHDMRAPQAAILALIAPGQPEIDRARIARHARHTLALADNFVDLARMQERSFDPEPIIAADLASEAADSLWPLARQRGVTIKVTDESAGAFVPAESESLYRALVNLIDNAVKYSPEGGEITVRVNAAGETVRISVSDQGNGIDPAMLPRLFERFASEGQGDTVKGVGLGLHYVATVIGRHGGTVAGQNLPDGGAVFTVTLPMEI